MLKNCASEVPARQLRCFSLLKSSFSPQNGALCGSKVKLKHLETNTNMMWVWLHQTQWGDRERAGPSVSGGSSVQMVTSFQRLSPDSDVCSATVPVFSCKDRIIKSNPNAVWESRRQESSEHTLCVSSVFLSVCFMSVCLCCVYMLKAL